MNYPQFNLILARQQARINYNIYMIKTIKYKARCGSEWDLFNTEQQANEWFNLCEGCEQDHEITQIVTKIKCEECGCETDLLDEDFEEKDLKNELLHWKDCNKLLDYEPDNQE